MSGDYRHVIDRLGLTSRVVVHNRYVPNEQVGDYFAAADTVVLPYLAASQSAVGTTALSFGLPVIASDVGGLRELVLDGTTGMLVPPGRVRPLARRHRHSSQQRLRRALPPPPHRKQASAFVGPPCRSSRGARGRAPLHPARVMLLRTLARLGARLPVGLNRRWPPVLAAKRWLLAQLHRERVTVDGFDLALDATDSLRLGLGDRHQEELLAFFANVLRAGDRVVDGGAHIGYLTLHCARRVAPTGTVWAVEPDPGNCSLLERNLLANRVHNVTVVRTALWSSAGTKKLYLRDDHHADHRLWDPGDHRPAITVPTARLDDLLPEDEPVRLVKLDLQGAEGEAIQGMEQTLRQPGLILVLELWPAGLRGCGNAPEGLIRTLETAGYRFWRLDAAGRPAPTDPWQELARLETSTWRRWLRAADWCDVICSREPLAVRRSEP